MHLKLAICTLTLLAALPSQAPASPVHISGTPGIVDGDTLRVGGTRIRLTGIDAPEKEQSCTRTDGSRWMCGQEAAKQLQAFIAGRTVDCVGSEKDRYQRLLAARSVAGIDIGSWMVSHGWAVAYRRYSDAYVGDEDTARKGKLGIWAGQFTMPWVWRQEAR